MPSSAPHEPPLPAIGALMLLEYKGDTPQAIYGEVTKTRYPFDKKKVCYVDTRDAVLLLGPEYDTYDSH